MRIALAAVFVALVPACSDPELSTARSTRPLISDELHNGGTEGFLFLPPMVPAPAVRGDVVADLPVQVVIEQLDASGQPGRTVATFRAGDATAPVRFKVAQAPLDPVLDDGDTDPLGYYVARWDTERNIPDAIYRARVLVPGLDGQARQLGFADVDIVPSQRAFRSVDRAEYTPLVAGHILRIKFRIDRPAVDVDGDGTLDWEDHYDDRGTVLSNVHGRVSLSLGKNVVAPRGLDVWLTRLDDHAESARVKTGLFGEYLLSGGVPAGTWSVCSAAPGLAPVCDAATFTVTTPGSTEAPPHRRAVTDYVAGRVTLADGTPCVWRFPMHGIEVDTLVEDADTHASFRTNGAGEFVIFGVGSRSLRVAASCEAARTEAVLSPGAWGTLRLPNTPPKVRGLVARTDAGFVERLTLGAPLRVRVSAVDDEGDALVAHWAQNDGPIEGRALELDWTPSETSPNLELVVGDGRGGYDLEPLRHVYSAPPPPSVRLTQAIAGVIARQGAAVVAPELDGVVRLAAWDPSAPLVISAPGHVDRVVVGDHAPDELPLTLVPCERVVFDTASGGTLRLPSAPTSLAVIIPPGSVVTADGAPHVGLAEACLAVIDASGDHPLGGLVAAEPARVLTPVRSAWVDVRSVDPSAARLAFAPDAAVRVDLRLGAEELATLGAAERAYSYADGLWTETAPPVVRSDRIILALSQPGGATPADPELIGCVRLWLGGLQNRGNYALRYRLLGTPSSPAVVVPITPGLDLLSPLPANRTVRVEILDLSTPFQTPVAEWTRDVSTGNALLTSGVLGERYPYDGCGSDIILPPPSPATTDTLSRYTMTTVQSTSGVTKSPGELSTAYYATVDPNNARFVLWSWRMASRVALVDPSAPYTQFLDFVPGVAERRFDDTTSRVTHGRSFDVPGAGTITSFQQVHFSQRWSAHTFAATPEGDTVGSGDRLLAIEVHPATATLPQRVLFFAFVGNGRVASIDLDGNGLEPVPAVCMNCHGGDPLDLVSIADSVVASGRWPSQDLGAHTIPFAVDTFAFAQPSSTYDYSRPAMEPRYRHLNELLLNTPLSDAGRALVHGAYGSSDPAATTLPTGANYQNNWSPPGGAATGWDSDPLLYREVVAPYCRSCHLQAGPSFETWADFVALADLIEHDVCVSRSMPHAAGTSLHFWTSSPYAPGRLQTSLATQPGWSGVACNPP